MSNLSHLLHRYGESTQVKALSRALTQPADSPPRVQLTGLAGAQRAFVVAAAALQNPAVSHLLIAESKEEAAYFLNDLESLLDKIPVRFFPDSFKRPAFFDELNATQVLQRSETVSTMAPPSPPMRGGEGTGRAFSENKAEGPSPPLMGGLGGAIITYPEALFEKVVDPAVLSQDRIVVTVGERLDVDFVIEILVDYGFTRADFVYEPGQFSIRGGIVDLFSYGNELPYRIELFDDEVESIRTFDPLTQLSRQNIGSVSIVPNLNTRFRQDQKVSLLQVLPPGTVIWVKDFQFVLDRLQFCFEKAEQFAKKVSALDSAELREVFRDRAFLYPREVVEEVKGRALVFWEKQTARIGETLQAGSGQ